MVLTHLHYDHVGNFHKFAKARFHLQTREMGFVTGPYMRYPKFGHCFEVEDVVGMVKLNFKGRVEQHNGDVRTGARHHAASCRRPYARPADRARHDQARLGRAGLRRRALLRAHAARTASSLTAFNLGDMVDGYRTCERLAASPDHIIPGHDPLVMKLYPAVSPELEGIIVRLDVAPIHEAERRTRSR